MVVVAVAEGIQSHIVPGETLREEGVGIYHNPAAASALFDGFRATGGTGGSPKGSVSPDNTYSSHVYEHRQNRLRSRHCT